MQQPLLDQLVADLIRRLLVHPHHLVVWLAVALVLVVGPDRRGDLGRLAVAAAGHQRRDRGGHRAPRVGVVGHPVRHQQRAKVRVAQPELAERPRVGGDLLGRVAGQPDQDLLRQEDDVHGVDEVADVDAEYARLKAAGATICEEMKDKPWGERSFVINDPNGVHLYIYKSIPPTPDYQRIYDSFKK